MRQPDQHSNPLTKFLSSAVLVGLLAILGFGWQIHSSYQEREASARQLAGQETQIAKQDMHIEKQEEQITMLAEQNQLIGLQMTLAAEKASLEDQLLSSRPTDNAEFAPTATALAIQSSQVEATRQAVDDRQRQIHATQTAVAESAREFARGTLLHEDSFDRPANWNIGDGIIIQNGRLTIRPGQDAVPENPAEYGDFVLESRFYIPDSGSIAFYVRHQRPPCAGWNCSVQIALYFGGVLEEIAARRFVGDQPGQQIDIKKARIALLYPSDWNRISVHAIGSDYAVYVNDKLALAFADHTYTSGAFIIDNASESSGDVKVDYLRVYQVP